MKNLLIIITLLLASCSSDPTKVENPQKETTLEILEMAKADTNFVKVVEIGNTIYVVDNDIVTHKVKNQTAFVKISFIIFLLMILIIIIMKI